MGFEPTVPLTGHNGFRDRPDRPLWHPSAGEAFTYRYRREKSRKTIRGSSKTRSARNPTVRTKRAADVTLNEDLRMRRQFRNPEGANQSTLCLHRHAKSIKRSAPSVPQARDEAWRVGSKMIDTRTLTVIFPQLFLLDSPVALYCARL